MEIYGVTFIGHRDLANISFVEEEVEGIAVELLRTKEYVEFYVGRNGSFDIAVASAIKRAQKRVGTQNSSLILVLPYRTKDAEYYEKFYDELWYPIDPATHYKAAIYKRNQWMTLC